MKRFLERLTGLLLLIATAPIIFIAQTISWLICGKTIPFIERYMNWVNDKLLRL